MIHANAFIHFRLISKVRGDEGNRKVIPWETGRRHPSEGKSQKAFDGKLLSIIHLIGKAGLSKV